MLRVCSEYGCTEVAQTEESRWCSEHARPEKSSRRAPRTSRGSGYDAEWDRLSRRARRLQPWCSDCGTTENLTADHLPSAWERKAAGLPLRLEDVDVVCNEHNIERGSSRPGTSRVVSSAEMSSERVREQRVRR